MASTKKSQTPRKSSPKFTDSTAPLPQDIYASLKYECKSIGISISQLCREADVDRSVLERWRRSEPKSINTYRALMEALTRMKNENSKSK